MMKRDNVDGLLRLAWLEGWINTHGAYERAVQRRDAKEFPSAQSSTTLIKRLERALAESKPRTPLTVGSLLRTTRSAYALRSQEIHSRIGVSQNIYRMMEHDTISPLRVPREAWKRLMQLFDLSAEELMGMLRRTEQLVFYRPSFKHVLARYSGSKKRGAKVAALEKAYAEMYAKANLKLPEEEEKELDSLVEFLRED